jgi:hypothetical protein
MACATGMTEPQLEQKRALTGNPVPHRLQKNAIMLASFRDYPL